LVDLQALKIVAFAYYTSFSSMPLHYFSLSKEKKLPMKIITVLTQTNQAGIGPKSDSKSLFRCNVRWRKEHQW
jgi:hypothetical protein